MASGLFTLKQQAQALRQGAWNGQKTKSVEYLVVAGGGGGGAQSGGGGGAGGLLTGVSPVTVGSAITVTVGAAGTGTAYNGSPTYGGNGTNSVFGAITAIGGGGGGADGITLAVQVAPSGGSGGGGGMRNGIGGQGVFGQGNAGGTTFQNQVYGSSGGGGAGTKGLDQIYNSTASQNGPGNGGSGVASVISGVVTAYAGGGGGGVWSGTGNFGPALGGAGGGGSGGRGESSNLATAGTANTGGGGGGGSSSTSNAYSSGANGGSGIVILSYPDVYPAAASTTGSPTVSTSGSGSISFNGAGTQSVNYAGQTPFSLGTGEFTIECWVYFNALTGNPFVIDFRNGAVSSAPGIYISGSNTLTYFDPSVTVTIGTVATSTWYHVAVTRNGTSLRTFLNGTLANTASDSQNLSVGSDRPVIGGYGPDPSQSSLNGYLSNLRIVKGTCLYTASFTPSTAPLTAVSGTSLLLNTVSGAYLADSSTNSYVGVLRGTPSWNSASPFATGIGYKNRVYTWTSSGSITF